MPLLESETIILRSRPFGEADKLVSFLSRTEGRLRGVAPSARRSRRRFGAALQPLTHVRLWFFGRERRELVRLQQTELLESYWDTRGDYERSLALNQVAELAELLLPEHEPSDRAFRLLLATLQGFKRMNSLWLPLTYYQLWSVRLAGWLPSLDECSACKKDLADQIAYTNPTQDRLLCRSCRTSSNRLLRPEGRLAALEMLRTPLHRLCEHSWNRSQAVELGRYLLDTIEYHSERRLITRELMNGQT